MNDKGVVQSVTRLKCNGCPCLTLIRCILVDTHVSVVSPITYVIAQQVTEDMNVSLCKDFSMKRFPMSSSSKLSPLKL
jgi:hypothetical protein